MHLFGAYVANRGSVDNPYLRPDCEPWSTFQQWLGGCDVGLPQLGWVDPWQGLALGQDTPVRGGIRQDLC